MDKVQEARFTTRIGHESCIYFLPCNAQPQANLNATSSPSLDFAGHSISYRAPFGARAGSADRNCRATLVNVGCACVGLAQVVVHSRLVQYVPKTEPVSEGDKKG